MAVEIERKFLLHELPPGEYPQAKIRQGYLSRGHTQVRVRVSDSVGLLTVKGPKEDNMRPEYEYEIPKLDAEFMLRSLCNGNPIKKTRYFVRHSAHVWHVDVFEDANAPLIIAEIELKSPREAFDVPAWVGAEVTDDERFSNSHLSSHPYRSWTNSTPAR